MSYRHVLVTLAAIGLLTSPTSTATAAPTPPAPTAPRAITLVTGDLVILDNGRPTVRPGPGRDGVTFHYWTDARRDVHVLPTDTTAMIKAGTLDGRLFNVTALLDNGYGDGDRKDIPLLVTGTPKSFAAGRDLSSIGAKAIKVEKSTSFWSSARNLRGDNGKIWLDGRARATLDRSAQHIGAPEAWKAGHTGKDALVAVLDTGIDADHPDLAGAVVDAKDFSNSPSGPVDKAGHGTHVASTITGEHPRYRGIAPDSKLLNGKVLDDNGEGWDSDIIAGMEWATQRGAKIVNMSLGGRVPSDGSDALSQAVNELTAKTGTLFVAAAGNISDVLAAPGAADAAVTVGAVDVRDRLDPDSARGPRIVNKAIKPDIVAPGVDITAARVGGGHMMASGTSMATPHVAGTAAILLAQHPDWSATQLKSALMASAKKLPEYSVFEQGTGRVDVARAVGQSVFANPPSISNGIALWPHDDDQPIVRTLTYTNTSTTAKTLKLSVDGSTKLFSVEPREITIPAGGKTDVKVTTTTAVDERDGLHTANIVATGSDIVVHTPIAVDREVESYDVKIAAIDHDGNPTPDVQYVFAGTDNSTVRWFVEVTDPSLVRLPKGRYSYGAFVNTPNGNRYTSFGEPDFPVTENTSVTFDAREGKPIKLAVDRPDARPTGLGLRFDTQTPWGVFNIAPPTGQNAFLRPSRTSAPGKFLFAAEASFADAAQTYRYLVHVTKDGAIPAGVDRTFHDNELAKMKSHFAAAAPGQAAARDSIRRALPFTLDEYYSTDYLWYQTMELFDSPESRRPYGFTLALPRKFSRGTHPDERWNYGVFGPAFPSDLREYNAGRLGDQLSVIIPTRTDSGLDRRGFDLRQTGEIKLYRDDKLIGTSLEAGLGRFDVPAGPGNYRMTTTSATPTALSTKVTSEWSFKSDSTRELQPLPLLAVKFRPSLDDRNQAPATVPTVVPIDVQSNTLTQARVRQVQVSYDDGATWRPAPVVTVHGKSYTVLKHPKDAKFVSLKASAADVNGNTVDQTVIRAFALK